MEYHICVVGVKSCSLTSPPPILPLAPNPRLPSLPEECMSYSTAMTSSTDQSHHQLHVMLRLPRS